MTTIKSFSVTDIHGEPGDMFYIKHNSSNFTIIDCCLNDDTKEQIVSEIVNVKQGKDITRFISTHPDEDHICGLEYLDKEIAIANFYCVENAATKKEESDSFKHYCSLRDDENKRYFVFKGCKRKWMNDNDPNDGKNYGSSGISCLWPDVENEDFKKELQKACEGKSYNNISPIIKYSVQDGVSVMWMGDIEHEFLEKIKNKVSWPEIDILFAPHHGRESGRVSCDVLKKLDPSIIVIGDAPSEYLDYYSEYNTITQNSAGDIVFLCNNKSVDIYVSNDNFKVDYLENQNRTNQSLGYYIGSFSIKGE